MGDGALRGPAHRLLGHGPAAGARHADHRRELHSEPHPEPRPTSVELTDTYFAQGQCAAPVSDRDARVGGVTTYRVASCTDALAVATVTRRSPTVVVTVESATTEPGCEDTTDLTIDLAANLVRATGAQGTDGAMTAYACLRTPGAAPRRPGERRRVQNHQG